MKHWEHHPHVRTGSDLSFGERAADKLKAAFGSWTFLIILNTVIVGWIVLNAILPHASRWDVYPFILLNLGLSWLAAQQGGALQIAANRGDRIASEVAMGTHKAAEELLTVNRRQLEILARLDGLDSKVADLANAVQVVMAARAAQAAPATPMRKTTPKKLLRQAITENGGVTVNLPAWIAALAGAAIAIGAFTRFVGRPLWHLLRGTSDFIRDYRGEPARAGQPARAGFMERITALEGQVATVVAETQPNGGNSLRDVVHRIADDVTQVRNEQARIKTEIELRLQPPDGGGS